MHELLTYLDIEIASSKLNYVGTYLHKNTHILSLALLDHGAGRRSALPRCLHKLNI